MLSGRLIMPARAVAPCEPAQGAAATVAQGQRAVRRHSGGCGAGKEGEWGQGETGSRSKAHRGSIWVEGGRRGIVGVRGRSSGRPQWFGRPISTGKRLNRARGGEAWCGVRRWGLGHVESKRGGGGWLAQCRRCALLGPAQSELEQEEWEGKNVIGR